MLTTAVRVVNTLFASHLEQYCSIFSPLTFPDKIFKYRHIPSHPRFVPHNDAMWFVLITACRVYFWKGRRFRSNSGSILHHIGICTTTKRHGNRCPSAGASVGCYHGGDFQGLKIEPIPSNFSILLI